MTSHNVLHLGLDEALVKKNRVFISHRLGDKPYARAIAEYFEMVGLHYYFDEDDQVLRDVVLSGKDDDAAIVEAIEHGLRHSTHLLAVISKRTMGSWWVPFEIGSARATRRDVRHLLLPSITPAMVPEYLRLYPQLWTANDLFTWVSELTPWRERLVMEQHKEYLNDLFGELDPDEELVEHWYEQADKKNDRALTRLQHVLDQEKRSD